MTLLKAFAEYLESKGVATLGQDLFTSRAPSSAALRSADQDPNSVFWIKAAAGVPPERTVDGVTRPTRGIEVYYRNLSADAVDEALETLSDTLSDARSVNLPGYAVLDIEVEGPWSDQDLDDEERTVGLLQVTITIEKER